MDIEWYRDLAITIVAFTATIVFILLGVFLALLYRKTANILDLVRRAASDVAAVSSVIKELMVSPTTRFLCLVKKGLSSLSRFGRGERG